VVLVFVRIFCLFSCGLWCVFCVWLMVWMRCIGCFLCVVSLFVIFDIIGWCDVGVRVE